MKKIERVRLSGNEVCHNPLYCEYCDKVIVDESGEPMTPIYYRVFEGETMHISCTNCK